jgi:hypothetical protein
MNHTLERIWKEAFGASRTRANIRRIAGRRQHGTASFWLICFLVARLLLSGVLIVLCAIGDFEVIYGTGFWLYTGGCISETKLNYCDVFWCLFSLCITDLRHT